jgi:long-chain fatty acid transport protein
MVAGGVDWDVTPDWTLRGGIYRDQTPTQDMRRDPNVPDANRTAFAGGASHKFSDAVTLDLAAEYIRFGSSSIDRQAIAYQGSPAATQILTNGRLTSAHAIVLGAGARFTF